MSRKQNPSGTANIQTGRKKKKISIRHTWPYHLLLFPGMMVLLIYTVVPFLGNVIAFQNFKPIMGIAKSKWVGFENFTYMFKLPDTFKIFRNTLVIAIGKLTFNLVMSVFFAILLNEVSNKLFKKTIQTICFLPHFLSWVIVGSVAYQMFRPTTGMVNVFLMNAGIIQNGIPFLTEKWHWAVTYLLIGVWQGMGWGTIIYLAAITGISGELYEAAMIDGANRWQRIWNITLPGIRGTVVTLLIMNLGKVMGSNYERLDQFGNTQVKDFSYQLAIYIYDKGLASAKFSMATAVGIFQSLVGLVLVLLSDRIAKMLGEEGLL